jgi:hypothetical protein
VLPRSRLARASELLSHLTGQSALDRATLGRYRRRYAALLAEGEAAERAHSPPPTRAEPTKGKLKRTPAGAHTVATLRSYVVTARKQGPSALDARRGLFTGHPFLPAASE